MQIITCPNPKCRAQLFVSNERAPKCGSCGTQVQFARNKSPSWISWLRGRLLNTKARTTLALPTVHPQLRAKVSLLATRAWGSREDIKSVKLEFSPNNIERRLNHEQFVAVLLKHVDSVAPGISVPRLKPRVVVEPMPDAAGQFIEQDGWIKIAVNPSFSKNMPAARSILCHELCHYVLNANSIRQSPTIENERLTDTAMFVFGLGDIFLSGYQKSATKYRAGHQLGYLSKDEYKFVKRYVVQLRNFEPFLKTAKRNDDWRWDRSLR